MDTYSVKIIKKSVENNKVRVWVHFIKGVVTVEQDFVVDSPADLGDELRRRVALLKSVDSYMATPVGDVDLTVSPSAVDIDLQSFENNLSKLKKAVELVSLGILTGNEPFLITLKTVLKNKFKVEYLDDL